jgi:transcriptional regulator with XRE-family HTH domain
MSKQRPIYKKVGERIKARRKAEFLTQVQLAGYCNMSQTYLSQIERGEGAYMLGTLHEICLYLHISMSDLLKDL